MGLFNDFAAWGRANRLASEKAEQAIKNQAEIELLKKKQALDDRQAQQAIAKIAELGRQKALADQGAEIPPEQHAVVPDWGLSEQLQMARQYGKAGLDPKAIAEAEKARLVTDAYEQAMAGIKDPAQLGNLANKQDVSPYRQSGQVTYNRYSGDKTYTPQGMADARKAKLAADDAELRLDTLKPLLENPEINPLLAADIAQDKSVFKPEKVEIEGPDGKTRIGYATMTPSGKPVATALTDSVTGKPLSIPVEGGDSAMMQQARELVKYGRAKDIKEAQTILTSSRSRSPEEAWTYLYNRNSEKDRFGRTPSPKESLTNTLSQWMMGRYGQPIPVDIERMIGTTEMTEEERSGLLAEVQQYNRSIAEQNVRQTATNNEVAGVGGSGLEQPFYNIPGLSSPAPMPQPAAPIPQPPLPEPPPPEPTPLPDFGQFAQTVMTNNNPTAIRAALAEQGMNVTDEGLGVYLTNAVNAGADKGDIDFLAQLLGLDLKLTDGG